MKSAWKNKKRLIVLIALGASILVIFAASGSLLLFLPGQSHSSTTQTGGEAGATYVTSSAPNSSEWLIVKSISSPISVSTNNSGMIEEYSDLASLNQTKIGVYCESVSSSGACLSFKMYEETGWFWDSTNQILYVHYVGGRAVKLAVFAKS
ncbi:MAG: hypothetical protein ACREBS_08655 [Nitrososphaerales archaeon]